MTYLIRLNAEENKLTLRKVENTFQLQQTGRRGIQGPGGVADNITGLIAPGTSVTIDGDGTSASPYIINSTDSVSSVNGKTGAVVINAGDVGADASGSASNALTQANTYTDAQIDELATVAETGDYSDLLNKPTIPVVNYPVTSVNGKTGAVVVNKSDVGLSNVDNTSDANKPVSSATQTALNTKEPTIPTGTTAQYIRGDKTLATLNKAAVGLSNVDNTTDLNKPISTATQTALNAKGQVNSIIAGTNITVNNTDPKNPIISSTASGGGSVSDATTTAKGIIQLAGDLSGTAALPTVPELANKQATLVSGANIKTVNGNNLLGSGNVSIISDVTSVNSKTGAVVITKGDVGLANVDNTSDLDKPISTATQTELNNKQPSGDYATNTSLANKRDRITSGVNQVYITDANGADSMAQYTASATASTIMYRGTNGIVSVGTPTATTHATTKTYVDTALALKSNIASPTFTGTPAAPTAVAGTNTTQIATTAFVTSAVASGGSVVTDATTTTKGVVKLAGDLAGTADLPTVPGLATKEPTIIAGTTAQYWRGDKTFQTLNKSSVGLANVDNTSDATKPVSSATQTALDTKANTADLALVATSGNYNDLSNKPTFSAPVTSVNTRTGDVTGLAEQSDLTSHVNNTSNPHATTKTQVGLSNVDNTSDLAKPISTATQTELDNKVIKSSSTNTTEAYTRTNGVDGVISVSSVSGNSTILRRTASGQATASDATVAGNLATKGQMDTALALKQDTLTLTTTGTSGPATLTGSTLNVPQYSGGTGGGMTNPMTTAGDLIVGDTGGAPIRLPASTTANQVLRVGTASSTPAYGKVGLTTDVSGILTVANGGTGLGSYTTGNVLISVNATTLGQLGTSGTGTLARTAAPAFTGIPTAPTAAAGTNTTQIATTAFAASAVLADRTATRTLTNARITPRVTTLASGTSYTPAGDSSDEVIFSAPTGAFTVNAISGTPDNGETKIFRILTGSTAYTPTWNAIYVGSNGVALPSTFPVSSTTNLQFKYDSALVKWVLIGTDLPVTAFTPLIKAAQRTVTAATTITDADGYLRFNSSTAVTQALPTTGIQPLLTVVIKNVGAGTITISNTVDGQANRTIPQYGSTPFTWTGTAWEVTF